MAKSKRVNVYDRVNRERLLGTMDRWSTPRGETHYRAMCAPGPVTMFDMAVGHIDMSVHSVTLEKVTKLSKDGWEAEVSVVTDASLSDLCSIRGFRPALNDRYHDYDCGPGYPRAWYYDGVRC